MLLKDQLKNFKTFKTSQNDTCKEFIEGRKLVSINDKNTIKYKYEYYYYSGIDPIDHDLYHTHNLLFKAPTTSKIVKIINLLKCFNTTAASP